MKSASKRALLLLALIPAIALALPAAAVAQGILILDVRAGFDGYYKVGTWVPVQVVVANEGPDIEGELQLAIQESGQRPTVYGQPVLLPGRSHKQLTLYALASNYERTLTVRLVVGKKEQAKQSVRIEPLLTDDYLCGVVSDDPSALNGLAGLPPLGTRRIHIAHLTLSDIPDRGHALGSLDALIVHDTDTGPMSDAQLEALRGWVALGGHLIVSGGPQAQRIAAGLGGLLPARIQSTVTTSEIAALGDLARAPFIPPLPAVVAQVELVPGDERSAADSPCRTGCILAGKPELPLVVRWDVDRGSIDYLALDPELEPFYTWVGRDEFWSELFSSTRAALDAAIRPGWDPQGTWGPAGPSGFSGPYGSIGTALARIPGLRLPSVLLVMAFLLAYVVLVGPLNFWVLKLVDRRALAWATVPALILVFSGGAYVAGSASRGRTATVSEISIVRVQPESGLAAVDSQVGLYSPVRRTYSIRLPDRALAYRAPEAGYGIPGGTQGPLYVEQGLPARVRQFEVDVGAMSSFATQMLQPWQGFDAQLSLTPVAGSGGYASPGYHIEGTIVNRSGASLRNGVLVWESVPVPIGDLPPGASREVSADFLLTGVPQGEYLIANLVGSSPAVGKKAQEQERRRLILQITFYPYLYSAPSHDLPLDGQLTLMGWLDESPNRFEVEGAPSQVYATTLVIAPLLFSRSDPDVATAITQAELIEIDLAATGHP